MCLKCGHRGCGRNSEKKHAIRHYETPRSDPHCLVVSVDNWSVWCYICDDEVQFSRTGHLAQLLTNLKKHTSEDSIKRPQKRVKEEDNMMEVDQKTEAVNGHENEDKNNKENKDNKQKTTKKEENLGKSQKSIKTDAKAGIPVKGLSNLGNTCFFNSVIQNLSQTLLLRNTLKKVTEESLALHVNPGAFPDLEPVTMQLDQPGPLTLAMSQLLSEILETLKGVVTPQTLFTQVCKKAARFRGFQQQDSQELLRYLLDGMRAEEIKRIRSGITEALKQSRKNTDNDEKLKTMVQEYEQHGLLKNFVDQVFGGEMTSTIMCQQCRTVSVVTEMFLDLSLPVCDEAYRKKNTKKAGQKTADSNQEGRNSPVLTNGTEDIPTGAGSKYQQKKAKKQAKKQAKQQKRQQKSEGQVTLDSITSPSCADNEQTESSADVNGGQDEDSKGHEEIPEQIAGPETREHTLDVAPAEKEREEDEDSEAELGSSVTSAVNNRFAALSKEQDSKDIVLEKTSDTEQKEEEEAQLASEMEKVNLDDTTIEESDTEDQEMKEYTVVHQDPELAFKTMASRKAPEKQECSVQSCLFQFTEVETLTQNNSLLCVTCTKQQGQKEKAGTPKKNVYTDALKQMLISSPPPVLTLHLKRFQQHAFSICKVNRHVQFPMILDLAPYCGVKCKSEHNTEEVQILYSLYGVVEHRGTMRSGHYTAYVKVRPEHPSPTSIGISGDGIDPSGGSWFHISDTSVHSVSRSQVESCQAYLLFYERIG
ncbi:ubiquitin carboxyl-terminal hydrolase 16 isoform X2 [Cynoglossus semilaevis]|nr:ubiquitin carboxyl-terminal hydrolase 16 isoform X2 [Cynoglossus semilaevis]